MMIVNEIHRKCFNYFYYRKECLQMDRFNEIIKRLRTERKETQKDVSQAIGTDQQTLRRYETGERKPDIEILLNLSKHFNVSADYLLGLTENPCIDDRLRATCEYTGLDIFTAAQLHNSIALKEPISDALAFLDKYKGLISISRQISKCKEYVDQIVDLETALKKEYTANTNDNGDIIVDINNPDDLNLINDERFRRIGEIEEKLSFESFKVQQSLIESINNYKHQRRR